MMQHLALIMDGNRRWAKKRMMMPWLGHRQGAQVVEMVIEYCLYQSIPYLSLYTFSLENLQRMPQEINYLFDLIEESALRHEEFVKNNVKVRFVGDMSQLPEKTRRICLQLSEKTEHCTALVCNFLICYGAQQEIVSAVQKMVQEGFKPQSVQDIKPYLWLGNIPDPELIIRTGGVGRLSNFLLYQAAYSEIRFLDCLWPDLTRDALDQVVSQSRAVQKNFGV
ncbi:di-trans,poly-cis-decaprenylcistransferase [Candidatus Babeliales bacterium]|nr:di-trans,poly-cis-decaprenylcistransferase [Candidatus Babeliales bacterium]